MFEIVIKKKAEIIEKEGYEWQVIGETVMNHEEIEQLSSRTYGRELNS